MVKPSISIKNFLEKFQKFGKFNYGFKNNVKIKALKKIKKYTDQFTVNVYHSPE